MAQAPTDTAEQARELATLFLDLSKAVDQFRHDHKGELNVTVRAQLIKQAKQLNDFSDDFTAEAIRVTLLAIQHDLDKIRGVTTDAKQAVKTIQKIEKVTAIVSAGVALGSAIVAGDPTIIGTATKTLGAVIATTADKSA
jgi:hypothetical protein